MSARDLERDQTALFDVVMGEIVAPMDRAEPEPLARRDTAPSGNAKANAEARRRAKRALVVAPTLDTGAEPGQLAADAPSDDDYQASPDDVRSMFGRFTESQTPKQEREA